jgi:hypothetical protein
MAPAIWLWCARVAWAALPATAGSALGDALDGWAVGPARGAAAFLWAAWAAGLAALFVPRPWGCTILRLVAPLGAAAVAVAATETGAAAATPAIASGTVAAVLALSAQVATACANGIAYGDEQRFPLRIPTPLVLGPVPVAIAIAGTGALSGPLLLADGRVVLGAVTTVAGGALSAAIARLLHVLSRRWLVLVPAGLTIVDPLTLPEPVLMRRAAIGAIERVPGVARPGHTLDLRLGTVAGGIEITLREPVAFAPRRGRRDAELVEPAALAVAVVRPGALLARARERRIEAA